MVESSAVGQKVESSEEVVVNHRRAGLLLHPTSLLGIGGVGSIGAVARELIDFLHSAQMKVWQILPLVPVDGSGCPYHSISAMAYNCLLIDVEDLCTADFGALLSHTDFDSVVLGHKERVDFSTAIAFKRRMIALAYERFTALIERNLCVLSDDFELFKQQKTWLEDYVLFVALQEVLNEPVWTKWPSKYRDRDAEALKAFALKHDRLLEEMRFGQFIFSVQWKRLHDYAQQKGIKIMGDVPIFVAHNSADVWVNRELFELDKRGFPRRVAGVPPDYFSKEGQLWGNPLYDWERHAQTQYDWWMNRLGNLAEMVDIIRLDHFRGFAKYWRVPAGEKTAIKGSWEPGPGADLFRTIENALGKLPIIAEDLGVITPDVVALREAFDLPGMKILQFAFDSGEDNNYLPHTYDKNCVVYTGTHDNDTTRGWFDKASDDDKHQVRTYLQTDGNDICWDFIHAAWSSVANMAMVPLQDLLALDSEARMNTPSTLGNNWTWRFTWDMIPQDALERLNLFTKIYGR